ncbi:hypothetical protein PYCCODRAFT_1444670 [Trametes coccinea BRFM310]|uniref:Uncharacterized protein n=1 Tax=Trametes coccinea (strain BRFM310) TaxID=1353009 RepID=A0A1Y2IQF5_TRAC3|nr:hypothetical protein PYCCODRAFT_1444670 [Trametes coccinea BRFM310]
MSPFTRYATSFPARLPHPEIWRQTRSGTTFSPWTHVFGTPLHVPEDFDLKAHIKVAAEAELQADSDEEGLEHGFLPATDGSGSDLLPPHATFHTPPLQSHADPASRQQYGQPKTSKDAFHSKKRSKDRRREKRAKEQLQIFGALSNGPPIKAIAHKRRAVALALPVLASTGGGACTAMTMDHASTCPDDSAPIRTPLSLATMDLPVAKSAFIAKRRAPSAGDGYRWTSEELVVDGFELIKWDGIQCRPILDRDGVVFAVLGGQPRDRSWAEVNSHMCTLLETSRTAYAATTQQANHRRGDFMTANVGISFGGGQKHVSNLAHTQSHQAILDSMLQQSAVRRIATFQSSVMRLFAPRLHSHYAATLDDLCARHPDLRRNLSRSDFSCMTFNMGPRTRTVPHRDHLNLPYGWCAITALGTFNPKRAQESRYSLTQYTAGGVFRWVACGFQSARNAGLSNKDLGSSGQAHWQEGLQLLSHWSEFDQLAM